MAAVFQTYINTPPVENSVLYSLLFFINGIGDTLVIDTDTQIRNIEENILTCSVHIIEMILGIEVTDDILANKKQSLRQLAETIKMIPKLSDEAYEKKLMNAKFWWRSVIDSN